MRASILVIALFIGLATSPMMLAMGGEEGEGPIIMITSPTKDLIDNSTVTLSWESDSSVKSCTLLVDGEEVPGIEREGSITLTLDDGAHLIQISAYTDSGSIYWVHRSFLVDTINPSLDILSPRIGQELNTGDIVVRWSALDTSTILRSTITLLKDGESWGAGPWAMEDNERSFMLEDLLDGDYLLCIKVLDGAGRSTEQSIQFSIDTTIPVLEILSPLESETTYGGAVSVTWMAQDDGDNLMGFEIYVNGEYYTTVAPTVDTIRFNHLKDGEYTVEVVAVDSANNTAIGTTSFLIDTVPLKVVETFPGDGALIGEGIHIRFSKPVDGTVSHILVEGVDGEVIRNEDTLSFVPLDPWELGTSYAVVVSAMDHGGRWLNYTWAFTTTSGSYVSGFVKDIDGTPLPDARVYMPGTNGPETVTAEDGSFRLEIPSGSQMLTVSKSGYVTRSMPIDISPGIERSIGIIQMTSTEPIVLVGWVTAILAIILVIAIYYFRKRRGRSIRHKPPIRGRGKEHSRSWRGLEERRMRLRDLGDDDYEHDR